MANTRPVRGTTAFDALSAAGSGRRTSAGRESISATDSAFPQWSERRSGFLRGRAGVGSALGCRHKPARRRTEGDLAARKGGSRRLLFPRPDAAARFQRGAVPGRCGDAVELEFDGRASRICGGRWPQEFHPYFVFWRKGQPHLSFDSLLLGTLWRLVHPVGRDDCYRCGARTRAGRCRFVFWGRVEYRQVSVLLQAGIPIGLAVNNGEGCNG